MLKFIVSLLVTGAAIIACLVTFPLERLQSNERADNPQHCPYYVTLQAILANYPQLAGDKANIKFIKQRLVKFERDISRNKNSAALIEPYAQSYYNKLSVYHLKSIANTNNPGIILAQANAAVVNIDNYYLDGKVNCTPPLQDWKKSYSRNVLNYNLGGITYNTFTDRYKRFLFSTDNGFHLGAFWGNFVNNQTTTLTTQFLTGMPVLTALYVLPRYHFNTLGSYKGLVPWCAFSLNSAIDPFTHKILSIAGIDAFIVSMKELDDRIKTGELTGIPNMTLLTNNARPDFGGKDYDTYLNNDSYGVTYLANQITYVNPKELRHAKHAIERYFAHPEHHELASFTQATTFYYNKLLALQGKHDVILEVRQPIASLAPAPEGSTTIKSIVGERALFNADCPAASCLFVFNLSHAPGWHAVVNGKFQNIMTVNFAFMGVQVPKGQSTIWFIYQPFTMLMWYLLSMLTLIGIFFKLLRD